MISYPVDIKQNRAAYAEKNVIGSILIDEMCIDIAMEIVKPQDFYTHMAEVIYSAMCDLRKSDKPINLATILSIVQSDIHFANNNGLDYLNACMDDLPSANQIESFCSMVRSESLHRKLLKFSDDIKQIQWSAVDDADSEIAKLGDELLNMTTESAVSPWQDFKSALRLSYDDLSSEDTGPKVTSGFIDLDAKMTGFRPGALTIVAARPAMGKTAFGLNILSHVAFDLNIPVAFFSLEMTTLELVNRVISSTASINGTAIRQKNMNDAEWARFIQAVEEHVNAKIFIDETPGIDISILKERARRLQRQHGIGLVIVDYLQLMHADNKRILNREQEVSTISRGLKALAKELKIPVIALAQLNRALDSRGDKHPIMSDLRESGSIEQDSDNILFIHREDYYKSDNNKDNTAEIIIAKQRNGPTGVVKLHWSGEFTRFSNLAKTY